MYRLFSAVAWLLPLLFSSSCAHQNYQEFKDNLNQKSSAEIRLPVEFFKQESEQCGPISLYTVLRSTGKPVDLNTVKKLTLSQLQEGSHKSHMIAAARRLGFAAYKVDLKESFDLVSEGHPVVVFQNLGLSWYPQWHFSVMVGYSKNKDEAYLHDGYEAFARMSTKRLHTTWRLGGEWSYAFTAPGYIPSVATAGESIENLNILGRIGKKEAARELLYAMEKRWPDNAIVLAGLANVYYENEQFDLARTNLEKAIKLSPKVVGLYYNLATVLTASGDHRKAQAIREYGDSIR